MHRVIKVKDISIVNRRSYLLYLGNTVRGVEACLG